MKLEDFLRQNIEHIDRPRWSEGPLSEGIEGKLKRLVSIKSIEEDREAGPDDD